jgi:hypothetical protein
MHAAVVPSHFPPEWATGVAAPPRMKLLHWGTGGPFARGCGGVRPGGAGRGSLTAVQTQPRRLPTSVPTVPQCSSLIRSGSATPMAPSASATASCAPFGQKPAAWRSGALLGVVAAWTARSDRKFKLSQGDCRPPCRRYPNVAVSSAVGRPRRWSAQEEMRRHNRRVHSPDLWGRPGQLFILAVEPFPFYFAILPAVQYAGRISHGNLARGRAHSNCTL